MKTVHELIVFADNFQFQLQDQSEEPEFPDEWSESLASQLFVSGDRVVGIGTVRDLDVEVTVIIHSDPMDENKIHSMPDCADFDHVVQTNIYLPSGRMVVTGCTESYDEVSKMELPPGAYGMRIFWSNLDSTDELGFEGDDHYKIELWPETFLEEQVIKAWRQLMYQGNPQNN